MRLLLIKYEDIVLTIISIPLPQSPLSHLNHFFEVSFVRDESFVSNDVVTVIPSQDRVTPQILNHRKPFLDLKLMLTDSRRVEP
jgi:hypothetical protein